MIDRDEAMRRLSEMPIDELRSLICEALDESGVEYETGGTGVQLSEWLFPRTITDGGWFGVVRWCDQDIENMLVENGVEPTDELVSAVRTECENSHHFTDGMIEAGWLALEDAARSAGVLK